jgi:hypothetical protein
MPDFIIKPSGFPSADYFRLLCYKFASLEIGMGKFKVVL